MKFTLTGHALVEVLAELPLPGLFEFFVYQSTEIV
jgi:hypothetical protein